MAGFIATHAVLTVIPALLIAAFDSGPSAVAFVIGSFLALSNFIVLFYYVRRIFAKKQVAMSSLAIIFKYLILGLIIYFIGTKTNLQIFWLGAGLISLLLTLILKARVLELESGLDSSQ